MLVVWLEGLGVQGLRDWGGLGFGFSGFGLLLQPLPISRKTSKLEDAGEWPYLPSPLIRKVAGSQHNFHNYRRP